MKNLTQLYDQYMSAAQMAKNHAGTPSERQWHHIAQKRLITYQEARNASHQPDPATIAEA